jgi:hypothetical protein
MNDFVKGRPFIYDARVGQSLRSRHACFGPVAGCSSFRGSAPEPGEKVHGRSFAARIAGLLSNRQLLYRATVAIRT